MQKSDVFFGDLCDPTGLWANNVVYRLKNRQSQVLETLLFFFNEKDNCKYTEIEYTVIY